MIDETRIYLSALWTALMLIYLLGDVLRIFSDDYKLESMGVTKITKPMYLGIAVMMVTPIIMLFLSLTMPYELIRPANIILSVFFFVFNLIAIPGYPSAYDKFLLIISLGFNILTIAYAWNWTIT